MSAKYYLPNIFDFERLFSQTAGSDYGFPCGSTILVAGPPGAGKTIFTLGLVRDLMKQHNSNTEKHRLYYVSPETGQQRLQTTFGPFGWFDNERDQILKLGTDEQSTTTVPIVDEISINEPVRGSDELVNVVFSQIDKYRKAAPAGRVFVVVDSLTAILKDSRDAGERRRRTHEFIQRMGSAFGERERQLALAFLIAEQPPVIETEVPADEIAAQFVFRLRLRDTGAGRRLRTMEVVKSHGAKVAIGEHTWAIVTDEGLKDVIAQRLLREEIERRMRANEVVDGAGTRIESEVANPTNTVYEQPPFEDNKSVGKSTRTEKGSGGTGDWGSRIKPPATIVVFPRPQLKPIGENNTWVGSARSRDTCLTGTHGLDEMLRGDSDYFARPLDNGVHLYHAGQGGLFRGSSTLLLGRSGTGKTLMCLQFLLQESEKSLYVNFESPPWQVLARFPSNATTKATLSGSQVLYRHRANLDVNAFFAELRYVLENERISRIAIDGLSDLLSTTEAREYSRLVETLLETIRSINQEAIVFVTLEMEPNFELFPMTQGLSMTADNIVVLRQLPINDELRKTAYVLKARNHDHDRQVREVRIFQGHESPLRIVPGLETYGNLLVGHPKPVTVVLQLFAENRAEQAFNRRLTERLKRLFGHPVRTFDFSRHEVTRTLADAAAAVGRIPQADIKLVTLDEWWIREYAWKTAAGRSGVRHPLLRLDPFVTSPSAHTVEQNDGDEAERTGLPQQPSTENKQSRLVRLSHSDFWVFEIEKCSVVRGEENSADLVALPNYLDFGLFCINRRVKEELGLPWNLGDFPAVLDTLPRVWTDVRKDGLFVDSEGTLLRCLVEAQENHILRHSGQRPPPFVGFAFDMETAETAVCTFFEFCWAFGAPEGFLTPIACSENSHDAAIATALRFLQTLVLKGLMPYRSTLNDARHSLFSRHWYSTLAYCATDQAGSGDEDCNWPCGGTEIWPVPCFPIGDLGATDDQGTLPTSVETAFADIQHRFRRLRQRLEAACTYRGAGPPPSELPESRESETNEPVTNDLAASRIRDIDRMRREAMELEQWVLRQPAFSAGAAVPTGTLAFNKREFLPAARAMDARDVLELLRWHKHRIDLVAAELKRLGAARNGANPQVEPERIQSKLTGYAASGSWLAGVHQSTHSPNLSWKVLQEMTSLRSAVERSAIGQAGGNGRVALSSGMPARKDFFEFYGAHKVPLAEHLTWNELLVYAGARARRRDRVTCPTIPVSDLFFVIYRELMDCLAHAEHLPRTKASGLDNSIALKAAETIRQHILDNHPKNCDWCKSHREQQRTLFDYSI